MGKGRSPRVHRKAAVPPTCRRVGQAIRVLREAAGLTQAELALLSGIGAEGIRQVEGQFSGISLPRLEQIAKGFRIPLSHLVRVAEDLRQLHGQWETVRRAVSTPGYSRSGWARLLQDNVAERKRQKRV